MDVRLFQVFCFLSFIAFSCSAENPSKHYDLIGLFTNTIKGLRNSIRVKELQLKESLQFLGIGEDFEFMIDEYLENSTKCAQDISYTKNNSRTEWALKLFDSYGKPESGILTGNFRWLGDYNECVGVRASNPNSSTVGNFKGKYCSLTLSLKPLNLSLPYTFISGICVPDSCSIEELKDVTLQYLNISGILPFINDTDPIWNVTSLECKPTERHLNGAAEAIIALLSLFFLLSFLGSSITVVKYFQKIIKESKNPSCESNVYVHDHANDILEKQGVPDDEALLQDGETTTTFDSCLQWVEKILGCFCIFTNGAKLLNTASSEGDLLCIHGIRFLSMSWVIIGHTYAFGYSQMKNMLDVLSIVDNFPFQAIIQAFFSVDSFFVLSGFLLAFLSMKEFSKTKGHIFWPYFYIHRYLRLTPMYMILLGFSATVYLYLGSGPYWPKGDYDEACSNTWWRNLLYINNFDLEAGQCMGWSWYLANDMQFFIISPLFLITLWRRPIIGYFLLAIFLLTTFLCNFIITYHFDLANGVITFLNEGLVQMEDVNERFADYFTKLYVKPYTRIGPYLVGMLAGFIFFKRKASNAPKHSLVFLTIGWIVASCVTLATVYGLYHAHPNLFARSVYNALSRVCFAGGLSWVIYVCLVGQGGFINRILSLKLFIPLSRLTYAAYLIHPMIITGYFMSIKTTVEFTHQTIVTYFLGFMLVTYALALPVALILESPIVSLEKIIRKKFTAETKAVN